MFEFLTSFIINHGYLNLFILSFLASTVLPVGSEPLLIALVYNREFNPFLLVFVASLGNYLGSCTTYYIGLKGRSALEKYHQSPDDSKIKRSEELFKKYGKYTLLLTWLPGIGDAISAVAGFMKISFKIYSMYVFTGKFLRYFAVAYTIVYLH